MAVYTFVLHYSGGTYLRQVRATLPSDAVRVWAARLHRTPIPRVPRAAYARARAALKDEVPTAIAGLDLTWCVTFLLHGKLAMAHFVRTALPR